MTHAISTRLVIPLVVVVPLTGYALIVTRKWWIWSSEWLLVSIPFYLVAFFFALLVQNRGIARMIEVTGGHPVTSAISPSGEPRAAPVSREQMGPPEFPVLVRKVRVGGTFLHLAIIGITVLMVWKPGACLLVAHAAGQC